MVTRKSISEEYDSYQLEAINAPREPLAILAGPGSGKTRTLVGRIFHYVYDLDIPFDKIFVLTYTNKAVAELKQRINYSALKMGLNSVNIQVNTFHSAAFKQLRYFWKTVFPNTSWELIAYNLPYINKAAAVEGLQLSKEELKYISNEIARAKANMISPANYQNEYYISADSMRVNPAIVQTVYEKYENYKKAKENHLLFDYEDLIIYCNLLFKESQQAKRVFTSTYNSFFVDEYQDISTNQYHLLRNWLNEGTDLTVVGDVNQTIFSFAGSNHKYLEDFSKYFTDSLLIKLSNNYRSDGHIVQSANGIAGIKYKQKAVKEFSTPVEVEVFSDKELELETIAKQIKNIVADPANENYTVAVLVRINSQLNDLEIYLKKAGVDYNIQGSKSFFELREIKRLVSVILTKLEREQEVNLTVLALKQIFLNNGFNPDQISNKENTQIWKNQNSLFLLLNDYIKADDSELSLYDFLQQKLKINPLQNKVTLSSIHSAKGQEWDYVFIVNCNEGFYPIKQVIKNGTKAEIAEEKRIFYVGITRAKRLLKLSYYLYSDSNYKHKANKSRFLSELTLK